MANVAHSSLTSTNLHEPKGVAAAAANRVYVSNGSGSGSWTTVSNDVLASTAKAFQAQLFHIQYQLTSGTDGASLTATTWTTVPLTTSVTNEISSASIGSNLISLPAGTYMFNANVSFHSDGRKRIRLYNVTDGAATLNSLCSPPTQNAGNFVPVGGRFTLGGTKSLRLEAYSTASGTIGRATSSGTNEIYADVFIYKVA